MGSLRDDAPGRMAMMKLHALIPEGDEWYETSRHFALWTYGHVVEASEPYAILADMLDVPSGGFFRVDRFPDKPLRTARAGELSPPMRPQRYDEKWPSSNGLPRTPGWRTCSSRLGRFGIASCEMRCSTRTTRPTGRRRASRPKARRTRTTGARLPRSARDLAPGVPSGIQGADDRTGSGARRARDKRKRNCDGA
jgi:hypothetical protein